MDNKDSSKRNLADIALRIPFNAREKGFDKDDPDTHELKPREEDQQIIDSLHQISESLFTDENTKEFMATLVHYRLVSLI